MNIKNILYATSCLVFCIIIGAAIYEHVAVWPHAFMAPPASLAMFQGKYGLDAAPFWMAIHPVTLVLLIITLLVSWKSDRRKNILIALTGYVMILIITFSYFVPTLMSIVKTPYTETVNEVMAKKAKLWEMLSLGRLAALIALSFILLVGLTKSVRRK